MRVFNYLIFLPFMTFALYASGTTPPLPLPKISVLMPSPNLSKLLQSGVLISNGTFCKSSTLRKGLTNISVK